jgi:predicted Zn-dependent protease
MAGALLLAYGFRNGRRGDEEQFMTLKSLTFILSAAALLGATLRANASSVIPLSPPALVEASDAIFRGTVVGLACYRDSADGLIYTRTSLRVDEPLKGTFPAVVQVVHRGGQVDNENDFCDLSPRFAVGAEYLVFVVRGAGGRLRCTQGDASAFRLQRASPAGGMEAVPSAQAMLATTRELTAQGRIPGADVTDQAGSTSPASESLSGMLDGYAARFLQPDRGEPIPYLIDAEFLTNGISLQQATNAVRQALDAWSAVTSLKFKLEAIQNFGTSSATLAASDEKIRIQLHDSYDYITDPGVVGMGGLTSQSSALTNGWDLGGNVAGNDFRMSTRGYVVIDSAATSCQSLTTFTEVICHELGHALNLAHSSQDSGETNALLKEALMYYLIHGDGRGATLGAYDPPVIQQIYPSNTPPFAFDRMLDVTTSNSPPAVAGVNEASLGYDLQTTNLTIELYQPTTNRGAFAAAGSKIRYTPHVPTNFSTRCSPAAGTYWDRVLLRVSDGTNASPYARVRVVSLRRDVNGTYDGIPDYWMTNYFVHSAPLSNDNSRAADDADGDGLNNLEEYIAGMNPRDSNSAQRILSVSNGAVQFQAKPYEVYEVLCATNLTTSWSRVGAPFVPTNAPDSILTNFCATNIAVTVSDLPYTNAQMFFRVLKSP